jgi:uncharacterized membrane protein
MSITTLLVLNAGIVLMYFQLNLNYRLKALFGFERFEHKKPFDCYFCLAMWIGIIESIIYYKQAGIILLSSYVLAKTIDKLWNL